MILLKNVLIVVDGVTMAEEDLQIIVEELAKSRKAQVVKGSMGGFWGLIDDNLICLYPLVTTSERRRHQISQLILGMKKYYEVTRSEYKGILETLSRNKIDTLVVFGDNKAMCLARKVCEYLNCNAYKYQLLMVYQTGND